MKSAVGRVTRATKGPREVNFSDDRLQTRLTKCVCVCVCVCVCERERERERERVLHTYPYWCLEIRLALTLESVCVSDSAGDREYSRTDARASEQPKE